MATTPLTPNPAATTQPAPVDNSTAQTTPQVSAPVATTTPTPAASLVSPTPADQPTITPGEDTDEGLTAHTQLALQSAPYAVRKWLDIPNIKAYKDAIPDDAEDYTGGRLPQSGVKSGDTGKIGVYHGYNYTHDQDGVKSGQFPVHESVHMIQNMLPKSFTDKFPKEDPKDPYKDLKLTADDLVKMRKNGDTLWNHSREGQASLMQKYTARHEWLTKKATPQEAHDYMTSSGEFEGNGNAKFENAYAPYLDDMANAPVPKGGNGVQVNSTPMASPQVGASYAVQSVSGHPSQDGAIPGQSTGDAGIPPAPDGSTGVANPNYIPPAPDGSTGVPNPNYVAPSSSSSNNPLAITDDPDHTLSGGVQELNSVGAGIGEGLLSTVNGVVALSNKIDSALTKHQNPIDNSFLEGREKELATNNAQNPAEREIGYGGETLMEFLLGDEVLKGLSLGKRLEVSSKIAKTLEGSPRIMRAAQLGAHALMTGARTGAVQGAQTLVRTGGDVDTAATQAAAAGATGGLMEGTIGAAGSLWRRAGDIADGVKDLTTVAKNTPTKPEVVQSIGSRLQAADALRHSEYETGLNNMATQAGDATVDAANNPLATQAKSLLQEPVPSEHPIVAQAAQVDGDKLDKGVRGLLESISNGGVKDEAATEAAAQPSGIVDENGNPISSGDQGPVTKPAEPYTLQNLVALRQKIRSIASGYDYGDVNSRALRSLINAPDGKVAPLDQAIDQLMSESGKTNLSSDYKELRNTYRIKQRAFENPVVQKLMNSVDRDGNLTPKAVTDAANDFITQAKTEGGPLAGKKAGNIEALKVALGPDDLQDFGKQIVHNMLQDSAAKGSDETGKQVFGEVNPAKFMRTWNKISAETKGSGLFDLTPEPGTPPPGSLQEAQQQWATSTDPAKRGVSRLLSDAQSAAKLQMLTKAGIITGGGAALGALPIPGFGALGSELGMGVLSMLGIASETGGIKAGRNILDYISDHPAIWKTYQKLGDVAASKAASGAADAARIAGAHGVAEAAVPTPDRKAIKNTYKGVSGALGGTQ